MTRRPDLRLPGFLIAGAPRCGTTWLYHLLDRHPGVGLAKPVRPEPKFFLVDALYEKGLGYYSATWFAPLPAGRLLGEKSANYLESPKAAKRIAADLPGVKLVFILRDPVARAWSNYRWSVMNGLEELDFLSALETEADREVGLPPALRYARPHAYFSRGLYADLLEPYFAAFPRRDILCLSYEDIHENAAGLATTLHDFLGLDSRPQDAIGLGQINAAAGDTAIPADIQTWLAERYGAPTRKLGALLGPGFRLWPSVG